MSPSLLFCTYATAYLAVLDPIVVLTHSAVIGIGYREADYRFGGDFTRAFFAPVHIVDRQIRPDYWNSYCTLDDEIRDEKHPWGCIIYVNGVLTSVQIYAHERADLAILDKLEGMHGLMGVDVKGEAFTDSDLKKLQRLKNLLSLELVETRVTKKGARLIRRALPECKVRCIRWNATGLELY